MEQTKQYEYVDLGLPSGLKWAKCNVGATSETDYGSYFQWGDIEDKSNSDYSWESYKYRNGPNTPFTKYCTDSEYGTVDNKTTLEPEDDAASHVMGGDWRMPTEAEFDELLSGTTKEWITNYNGTGVNGWKFASKKDTSKYIFIPAAGYCSGGSVYSVGDRSYVWTSSLWTAPFSAWFLFIDRGECGTGNNMRYYGLSVRGVRK